jgi:hypothetical protein
MQALSQVFLESWQRGKGQLVFLWIQEEDCTYHHQVPPLVVRSTPAPDQKYLAEGTVEQTEQEEDDGVDHSRQGEGGSIDDRQSHAAAATIEETRGGGESLIYSGGSSYAQTSFMGDGGRR